MKIQLELFLGRFPIEQLKMKGSDCPFCGRGVKAYGYELDDKLVGRAIKIANFTGLQTTSWWPKEVFGGTDTEFNKLKYWHIIEKIKSKWRLTPSGVKFLNNRLSLPRKVWVYDDTVIEKEEELVNVEMVEPRWKYLSVHWKSDYIIPTHVPKQATLLV